MSEFGLQAVLNPSEMFLTEHDSDSEVLAGLAVAVILDGSRAFALEVQVLYILIIFSFLNYLNYFPSNTLHYLHFPVIIFLEFLFYISFLLITLSSNTMEIFGNKDKIE